METGTGIERLESLQVQAKELREAWFNQKFQVTSRLYSILNDLNLGPAPILMRENNLVGIEKDVWLHPEDKWKVRTEVYFVNQDPEKPNREYDFGSSFSLYITNNRITLNHGSCGEWGKDDKGQWSRLLLMREIFNHEQDIIDALDPLIDFDVRDKLYKVEREIDDIDKAIRDAQREKEELEVRRTIKLGKYICGMKRMWKEDPNNEDKYIEYNGYVGHEKITKICEKTVTTTDQWGYNRRYKIDQLIYKLRTKFLYIVDNTEVTPPEEVDPK